VTSLSQMMNEQLFNIGDEQFSFESHGVTLTVQRLKFPKEVVFKIEFNSKRLPLVISRAKGVDRPIFWTSIPEGRQTEAEGVGKLIEEYLLSKQ
jgi:hypothetical protein